jgi:hypothetical protein
MNLAKRQIIYSTIISCILFMASSCTVTWSFSPKVSPKVPGAKLINKGLKKTPKLNKIVEIAKKYWGVKYKRGGAHPSTGFDCSGYSYYVYQLAGIDIPRGPMHQFNDKHTLKPIKYSKIKPGDLVFFATSRASYLIQNRRYVKAGGHTRGISHVGIYVGNDTMIHSPNSRAVVRYDVITPKTTTTPTGQIYKTYWGERFRGAATARKVPVSHLDKKMTPVEYY